jgi:hypothetical protein
MHKTLADARKADALYSSELLEKTRVDSFRLKNAIRAIQLMFASVGLNDGGVETITMCRHGTVKCHYALTAAARTILDSLIDKSWLPYCCGAVEIAANDA